MRDAASSCKQSEDCVVMSCDVIICLQALSSVGDVDAGRCMMFLNR